MIRKERPLPFETYLASLRSRCSRLNGSESESCDSAECEVRGSVEGSNAWRLMARKIKCRASSGNKDRDNNRESTGIPFAGCSGPSIFQFFIVESKELNTSSEF